MTDDMEKRLTIVEQKVEQLKEVPRRLNYIDRDVVENRASTNSLVDKVSLLTKLVLLVLSINVVGILAAILLIIRLGGK